MSKDPAFLFYDGDAARDVSHMSRLERGCYFDLIQALRKFHGITTEQARKILGSDFDTCWESIEMILSKDSEGKYYIEWLRESVKKRAQNSEIQRERIQKYWDEKKINEEKREKNTSIPRNNHGITTVIPLEIEIENKNIKNKEECEGKKEKQTTPTPENLHPSEGENLYPRILELFPADLHPKNEKQKKDWIGTLEKLISIDGHPPEEILKVVDSTRRDEFWQKNFLSVLKLRKKNKEEIFYYTVFKNRLNGNLTTKNGSNQNAIEGRFKRVNQYWDR